MESMIGIFHSIETAEQAADELIKRDMPPQSIVLLSREEPKKNRTQVPHEKQVEKLADPGTGAVGTGKATGEVLGASIGGSAGFTAAATAAALTIPGLGIVFAIGLGGAALLGLGGAAAGAKIGDSVGKEVSAGVPKEQVDFYRQLLQRGYSLVVVDVRSGADISTVQEVFRKLGSEDVEKVRRELREAA
jgi:hypothetical protein